MKGNVTGSGYKVGASSRNVIRHDYGQETLQCNEAVGENESMREMKIIWDE
jgi:hypothetical protein